MGAGSAHRSGIQAGAGTPFPVSMSPRTYCVPTRWRAQSAGAVDAGDGVPGVGTRRRRRSPQGEEQEGGRGRRDDPDEVVATGATTVPTLVLVLVHGDPCWW